APLRPVEAIGMIEALQSGLAADAQTAAIHGMIRIALELHDAAVTIASEHAASGRALTADACEPRRDTRHHLLVRHDQRKDVLRRLLTAAGRGGRAGRGDDLEEVPSFHSASAISDDTRRSRAARGRSAWRSARGGSRCTTPSTAAAARGESRPR